MQLELAYPVAYTVVLTCTSTPACLPALSIYTSTLMCHERRYTTYFTYDHTTALSLGRSNVTAKFESVASSGWIVRSPNEGNGTRNPVLAQIGESLW